MFCQIICFKFFVSELLTMPVSQIHFSLRPGTKTRHRCTVQGYCIQLYPQFHYNVSGPFVIRPRKWIDIFLCNKHSTDSSCLISTKEGGVVSLRLYNDSFTKKIIIQHKTSLRKVIHYSLIRSRSRSHTVF